METLNHIMVKQLKNRYNDPTTYKRFCIGVNKNKMRLYDIPDAEKDLVDDSRDDGPIFDKTTIGASLKTLRV
jgi:hypothetical protein